MEDLQCLKLRHQVRILVLRMHLSLSDLRSNPLVMYALNAVTKHLTILL